jgi:hypothetical protein
MHRRSGTAAISEFVTVPVLQRTIRFAHGALRPGHFIDKLLSDLLDRVHAVWVKSEILPDLADSWERFLVTPHCIFGAAAICDDAEIAGVALVRAIRLMIGVLEQAHIGVGARDIEDRLVARLLERERAVGVGDYAARKRDAHAFVIFGDGDRMVGAGKFHRARLDVPIDRFFLFPLDCSLIRHCRKFFATAPSPRRSAPMLFRTIQC